MSGVNFVYFKFQVQRLETNLKPDTMGIERKTLLHHKEHAKPKSREKKENFSMSKGQLELEVTPNGGSESVFPY